MNIEVNDNLKKIASYTGKRTFDEIVENVDMIEAFQTKVLNVKRDNGSLATDTEIGSPKFSTCSEKKLFNVIDEIMVDSRPTKKKFAQIEAGILAISEKASTTTVSDNAWNFSQADANQMAIIETQEYENLKRKTIHKKKFTRKSTKKWSAEDKAKFYKGLELFGLDYTMISETVLTNRSTKEIASFLRKEDDRNRGAVDMALKVHRENKGLTKIKEVMGFPSLEEVFAETAAIEL